MERKNEKEFNSEQLIQLKKNVINIVLKIEMNRKFSIFFFQIGQLVWGEESIYQNKITPKICLI